LVVRLPDAAHQGPAKAPGLGRRPGATTFAPGNLSRFWPSRAS